MRTAISSEKLFLAQDKKKDIKLKSWGKNEQEISK